MKPLNQHSKQALERQLSSRGIDTSSWGTGTAKTAGDLWAEIELGEARLEDNPFRRVVSVVELLIVQDGRYLVEAEQEFEDGQRRKRHMLPAEKSKEGEKPVETARRCLMEELGLKPGSIHKVWQRDHYSTSLEESPSYPGLPTEYEITRVEAEVKKLPDTDFWTEEKEDMEKEPVRRHRWT